MHLHTKTILTKAEKFVREGVTNITRDRLNCPSRFLVSAAPVPTALAMIALTTCGATYQEAIEEGAQYLVKTRLEDESWGTTPNGPSNELATAICIKGLAAKELPWTILNLIHDSAYLVAKTWTQDFDRLAPGWLPKHGSPIIKLVEAVAGKALIPSLESITLKDMDSISPFMPPYGRPTMLSVTLIKDFYRQGLTKEVKDAVRQLIYWQAPNGSWCEDIVVTSLGIMALYLTGMKEHLGKACQWLCQAQYDNGGWPSFNQLTNWAVGWTAHILGPKDHSLFEITTPFLLNAVYQDGSFGTAPPFSYPDLDDTAVCLLGLACDPHVDGQRLQKTRDLLFKLQNGNGSWSTFPSFKGFPPGCSCDFPVYIKSEDITVHVIQALVKLGINEDNPRIVKGLNWLGKHQNPDGTWNSTWFLGRTYATAQVLDLFLELNPHSPVVAKGINFLQSSQTDGHWDMGSAGETGLALYTLLKAGIEPQSSIIQKGLDYLANIQLADGSFKPAYSGFYASGLYYEEPLSEALAAIRALNLYLELHRR